MNNILSLNKVSRSYFVRETLINVFSDIDIDIKYYFLVTFFITKCLVEDSGIEPLTS